MYPLLAIDALLRILAALLLLFVAVPAMARRKPENLDRFQWFWFCFAAGVTALTLIGQLFALLNIFSAVTLLIAIAALIVVTRARLSGRPATALLHDLYRNVIVFSLNILEGRVHVRRRLRRAMRYGRARIGFRWDVAGWVALIAVAAALRLVRPFATPNLGFSDTYAHLYLFRLLENGQQVDPNWGPYPRGMHFLLLAIHELTNVDPILLMNFFGAFAGVLMTVAVADTARRLGRNLAAGLVAGAIFATMIGSGSQYFLFGGSIATMNVEEARAFDRLKYSEIPPTDAEFDVLLTVFQRQTATLPQELAIVFLFPAAMFLMGWLRTRQRFLIAGYFFCCAAIAAVHPGVAVPLVLLSAVTVLAALGSVEGRSGPQRPRTAEGSGPPLRIVKAALVGMAGLAVGSTWMLAFITHRRIGPIEADVAAASGPAMGAMYYFPFLRTGETARIVTWVSITPFVIACAAIAMVLLVRAVAIRERRTPLLWTALAALVFLFTHVASRFQLPELVEVRRNSSWLAMALAILLGVALVEFARLRIAKAAVAVLLAVWFWRVPLQGANDRLINYSGYSAAAHTVIDIQRKLEPFTWTLVTYGQEFPMVLGTGFHLAAADFLDRYDPAEQRLPIPTKYVFIVVEKTPHRFQINTWAAKFSRTDLERRLQTWCFLYQLNHRDIRVWSEDENVRVYVIERSDAEVRQIAGGR